ncbi:hypothetical protein SHO565_32360 [Streptomyces sp. HO565]
MSTDGPPHPHLAPHKEPADRTVTLCRPAPPARRAHARPRAVAAQAVLAEHLPKDDPERAELTGPSPGRKNSALAGSWLVTDPPKAHVPSPPGLTVRRR